MDRRLSFKSDYFKLLFLQTLSEHYSRKCVELAGALEEKEKTEDSLKSLEREIFLLRSRKPRSSENEIHVSYFFIELLF